MPLLKKEEDSFLKGKKPVKHKKNKMFDSFEEIKPKKEKIVEYKPDLMDSLKETGELDEIKIKK